MRTATRSKNGWRRSVKKHLGIPKKTGGAVPHNWQNKFEREKELLRLLAKGNREIESGEGYDLKTKGDIVWIVAVCHGEQLPKKPIS